ncbi:hypothetical protein ACJX0J_013100, partial [Zea mays]
HKDECHPPSVNTRHDDEEEKAEVGVKQVAKMNKPVVGSETSDANHDLKSSNGKSKHMPSEAVCSCAEIPGGHKSNITVEISQNVQSVDSSKMGSSIKHAKFVEDGSSTEDLNEALPCNSHSSSPNINGHSSFVNKEFYNHSKEHQRAKDAHTRELEDSSIHHAAASVVLESKSSRTPIHVELERSKTKSVGNDSIQSTKPVPSALTVDSHFIAYSLPDISFKPSDRSGSTTNNLATSLNKMVRQQTAPKVTLFSYELFVKLYSKVELHPFGLHNLGSQNKWCFICEFEKLIVEGNRCKTALSPTGILSHLNDIGRIFGPGKQEDAHEFLSAEATVGLHFGSLKRSRCSTKVELTSLKFISQGKNIGRKGKHRWIKERKGRAPNYLTLLHSAKDINIARFKGDNKQGYMRKDEGIREPV